MTPTTAFISVNQIAYSYRLRHELPIHFHYIILSLAAEAVRELALTSMPLVNHKLITKADNETIFTLPEDYTDWVSAGVRQGEFWRPVGISNRLLPFPNTIGNGEFNSEFGSDINVNGDYTNWLNPATPSVSASFSPTDFSDSDFSTVDASGAAADPEDVSAYLPFAASQFFTSDHINDWGELKGRMFGFGDGFRQDVVAINAQKGLIMCPLQFPSNELYLVYLSIGTVDTMTHIPIQAQAAIEAYINWKYVQNKRNGLSEGRILKQDFEQQHRLLRSRLNPLTATDIKRVVAKYYGMTQGIG